jgi:hypothetical protein
MLRKLVIWGTKKKKKENKKNITEISYEDGRRMGLASCLMISFAAAARTLLCLLIPVIHTNMRQIAAAIVI